MTNSLGIKCQILQFKLHFKLPQLLHMRCHDHFTRSQELQNHVSYNRHIHWGQRSLRGHQGSKYFELRFYSQCIYYYVYGATVIVLDHKGQQALFQIFGAQIEVKGHKGVTAQHRLTFVLQEAQSSLLLLSFCQHLLLLDALVNFNQTWSVVPLHINL